MLNLMKLQEKKCLTKVEARVNLELTYNFKKAFTKAKIIPATVEFRGFFCL
jgi:hypothetical protein